LRRASGQDRRAAFSHRVTLRIHLPQQLFGHSGPAMEKLLHEIPQYQMFS
jgi:hypothetical protein